MVMNPLQNNDSFEQWELEGSKTADEVGRADAAKALDSYVEPPMPVDIRGALDDFMTKKKAAYQAATAA